MKFPLRVYSTRKEMGNQTRERKKQTNKKQSPTSAGIETTTSEFADRTLLYRLSYETRPLQVVDYNGGNCGSVM